MLIVRLKPTGRKKRISYRVVISERRSKLTGRAIDDLGYYNPNINPAEVKIDTKKLKEWKAKGADVSDAVKKIL